MFFCLQEIDAQLQREHKVLFQKKQELQTLWATKKNVLVDISGNRVALSSLDKRFSKLDQNALKQQENISSQARHPDHNEHSYRSPHDPRCCTQTPLTECALRTVRFLLHQDFQIQFMEGKMARLSGNLNKEEKQVLEKQVSELSEALEEKKKADALLAAQLKKLQVKIKWLKAVAGENLSPPGMELHEIRVGFNTC